MRKSVLITISFCLLLCPLLPVFSQQSQDALELYRQGKYTESISVCLQEIEQNPNNIESHVVLCWALVRAARYEEADRWAEAGRQLSRYDPRLIEIQGESRYFRGLNEDALRLFQEYISYAPNGSRIAEVYFYMGEIYLRLARYRHADIALTTALQMESLNAPWWVRLGYAREMAKELRPALDAYNRALKLNPNLPDALRGRDRVIALIN